MRITARKSVFGACLIGGIVLSGCNGTIENPPVVASDSGGSGGGASTGNGGGSALAECAPEGNTPDAMALCDSGAVAEPGVLAFCAEHGGCHTEMCSGVDGPPSGCVKGGRLPGSLLYVWCCAKRCESDSDCVVGDECIDGICA